MMNLLQQHLLSLQCGPQSPLAALALDGHSHQVRRPLEKGDVALGEVAFGFGIDLEHAERSAVALQNDVHGPPDTLSIKGAIWAIFTVESGLCERFFF